MVKKLCEHEKIDWPAVGAIALCILTFLTFCSLLINVSVIVLANRMTEMEYINRGARR